MQYHDSVSSSYIWLRQKNMLETTYTIYRIFPVNQVNIFLCNVFSTVTTVAIIHMPF